MRPIAAGLAVVTLLVWLVPIMRGVLGRRPVAA